MIGDLKKSIFMCLLWIILVCLWLSVMNRHKATRYISDSMSFMVINIPYFKLDITVMHAHFI